MIHLHLNDVCVVAIMLISMLMMFALTQMLLFTSFEAVAYADVNDANADAKMPNVVRRLAVAYDVLMM